MGDDVSNGPDTEDTLTVDMEPEGQDRQNGENKKEVDHAGKLVSLDDLNRKVIHKIVRSVSVIVMTIDSLSKHSDLPQQIISRFNDIEEEANSLGEMAHKLMGFVGLRRPKHTQVDIKENINRALRPIEQIIKSRSIKVTLEFPDDLPPVWADKNQLQRVFSNILTNALEAMTSGGRLTLTAREIQKDENKFVELRIEDWGAGIAREHMDKIFDPFYTTKTDPDCLGLGLAVCKEIIESHEGSISVISRRGQGATFTLHLLVMEAGERVKKVMVVDDDINYCKTLRDFLSSKGHQVVVVFSGDEAIELYKEYRPHVVVMDMQMPGRNGLETLLEIKAFDPEAVVIMATASTDNRLRTRAKESGIVAYLEKPFNPEELELLLRGLM